MSDEQPFTDEQVSQAAAEESLELTKVQLDYLQRRVVVLNAQRAAALARVAELEALLHEVSNAH